MSEPKTFRPGSLEQLKQAKELLAAQGWAGLHCGDQLRRLEERGAHPSGYLWVLPDARSGLRGVAVAEGRSAHAVVPLAEDRGSLAGLVESLGDPVDRLLVLDPPGFVPGWSDETQSHARWVTTARELRLEERVPVREASGQDAEQLCRVYDSVSWMRLDSSEEMREVLSRQRAWVAELDGQVVAVARWSKRFGDGVEIGAVATHPEFRRRGAAISAVVAATREALRQQLRPVLCYGDPELSSLYQPVGFELVGALRSFWRKR